MESTDLYVESVGPLSRTADPDPSAKRSACSAAVWLVSGSLVLTGIIAGVILALSSRQVPGILVPSAGQRRTCADAHPNTLADSCSLADPARQSQIQASGVRIAAETCNAAGRQRLDGDPERADGSSEMMRHCLHAAGLLLLVVSSLARSSRAQETDAVASEALFREGNRLFEAGNYSEACPKLAESYRLDAGTGTLLKLALCHERVGKLASAWTELTEAAGRAQRENDAARMSYAKERSQALEPRLSSLVIEVPPEVGALPGLEVRRDGVLLGTSGWNIRIPIDGGSHQIHVQASGKQPYVTSLSIATEAEAAKLLVPALVDVVVAREQAAPVGVSPSAPVVPPAPVELEASAPWGTLEWVGVASAGAGAIALGVGGYFLAGALHDNGVVAGAEAQGDRATLSGLLGGVLVAAGATSFIVGRANSTPSAAQTPVALSFSASSSGWGARLSARF